MSRAWNFSAGPAVLPESVLAQLQEVLLELWEQEVEAQVDLDLLHQL